MSPEQYQEAVQLVATLVASYLERHSSTEQPGDVRPVDDAEAASTNSSNVRTRASGRADLLTYAIEVWRKRAKKQPSREDLVKALTASIRNKENLIEKYLRAFESGTMPEDACGPRVRSLTESVAALQTQREQLIAAPDVPPQSDPLAGMDISAFLKVVFDEKKDLPVVKSLLRILIEEILVDGRTVYPALRVPPARP